MYTKALLDLVGGAKTPLEFHQKYVALDQELMKSGQWDFENPDLLVNQIKDQLEDLPDQGLSEEEREWKEETLWFWYHHAASYALAKKDDLGATRYFIRMALAYKSEGNPNQITYFLYLLIHDKAQEAWEYVRTIKDEVEQKNARELLQEWLSRLDY